MMQKKSAAVKPKTRARSTRNESKNVKKNLKNLNKTLRVLQYIILLAVSSYLLVFSAHVFSCKNSKIRDGRFAKILRLIRKARTTRLNAITVYRPQRDFARRYII